MQRCSFLPTYSVHATANVPDDHTCKTSQQQEACGVTDRQQSVFHLNKRFAMQIAVFTHHVRQVGSPIQFVV